MNRFPFAARCMFVAGIASALLNFSLVSLAPFNSVAAADDAGVVPSNPSDGHRPDLTANQLKVREGFQVRLAAAEPHVVDPVSAAWGTDGRLWVVEMPDYPTPRLGQTERHGRIQILSHRDSQGRFQHATTFVEDLDFATGVLPWRDGAIVTLAGQIVFLRDVDGDGRCDGREVWFEGFTIDNEQLRANHPTLGPDGWVYVAGGLRGGEIMAVDPRFKKKSKALKLKGRDFVFDPHGGDWTTVSGNSQHGLTIDSYNRRLGCSNRNPAIESVIPADVIDMDAFLTAGDATADVGKSGFESEVHPISDAWTTSNLHAGQFSAACGVFAPGWVGEDGDSEWLLVCEPTGSLVQRQKMKLVGGAWQSEREANPSEWLACGDDWFRPVDLVPDVDGGVLVIDMARAVIEHPHWAPPELKNRPDTFHGNDLGRVWQVRAKHNAFSALVVESDDEALLAIGSSDLLARQFASAYLYAKYPSQLPPGSDVIDSLNTIVLSTKTPAESKARIALLLNRWDLLSGTSHASLLIDASERLRSVAAGFRESNQPDGRPLLSATRLAEMFGDPSLLVRQSALAASVVGYQTSGQSEAMTDALMKLAVDDGADPWIEKLLLAMPVDSSRTLLSLSLSNPDALSSRAVALPQVPLSIVEGWMRRLAAKDPQSATKILGRWLSPAVPIENGGGKSWTSSSPATVIAVASAWRKGIGKEDRVRKVVDSMSSDIPDRLAAIDSLAVTVAQDENQSTPTRLSAVAWVAQLPELPSGLRGLVDPNVDSPIRAAGYRLMMSRDGDWTRQHVIDHADALSPSDRLAVVAAARGDRVSTLWLLEQIGSGNLARTFVDPSSMDWFRDHSDPKIAELGRQTFAPPGDVMAVLHQYASASANLESADLVHGKALFATHCANCHSIDGVGHRFGPDISDSREKTPESLLAAILDPSAAIDASFAAYQVLTIDGEVINGLLSGESGDAITLVVPGGQTRRIERDDVEIFRSSEKSLMPEGIQRSIDVDQMKDLLGYLKRWRYASMN